MIRHWYPLESSPGVFTKMARKWGLPEHLAFYDVLGLDEDLLNLAPGPVHAVILLFPDTVEIVKYRQEKNDCLDSSEEKGPLWIPQTDLVGQVRADVSGHSCGTFAVIHALASLDKSFSSALSSLFDACRSAPPTERTELFANCEIIRNAHNEAVTSGQTLLRDEDWEECDHFLSFVAVPAVFQDGQKDGEGERGADVLGLRLMEMDGNPPRTGPLDRGPCHDLLRDAVRVVKEEYLPRAGDNVHFSMMVLAG